jgi:hypothetical protein
LNIISVHHFVDEYLIENRTVSLNFNVVRDSDTIIRNPLIEIIVVVPACFPSYVKFFLSLHPHCHLIIHRTIGAYTPIFFISIFQVHHNN